MDAKIENGDLVMTVNGGYAAVGGIDEAVQRVRLVMMTNRGAFLYDRRLGVDYDAFSPDEDDPVGKLDMLVKEGIADLGGVDAQVTGYDAQHAVVTVRVTYNGRAAVTEVDISGNI